MFRLTTHTATLAAFALALSTTFASAQDSRQNEPGKFDFYILALSWSPSFCEASGERPQPKQTEEAQSRQPQLPECGERPYAFVVHGLWPQYEKGFPEFCQVPAPRLNGSIISSMLDLMPAPRLIFRQWDRHGTCSGLPARAYFDTVRKARAVVKIPSQFLELKSELTVAPEEAGMARTTVAVACDRKRLREVRICLTQELGFRECPDVERRTCRRDKVVMPPVRGATVANAR